MLQPGDKSGNELDPVACMACPYNGQIMSARTPPEHPLLVNDNVEGLAATKNGITVGDPQPRAHLVLTLSI